MRAVVLERYGTPDVLQARDWPRPVPAAGQILVRVHAASINPIDWRIRSGSLRLLMPIRPPRILGWDVSGEVAEIGPGVTHFQAGDLVYAFTSPWRDGTYAEFVLAREHELAPKPAAISHEEAAGIPLAGLTALQGLRDLGRLHQGDEVLVNGASGGVGTFTVQVAKALGARVTGVCSGRNVEFVQALGAERVIDYTREDFTQTADRYDIVLDAVAKSSYSACRRILKPRGRYITTVPDAGVLLWQGLTLLTPKRCLSFFAHPSGDDLRYLKDLVEQDKLRSIVEQVFPLAEAARAHAVSEAGRVRGKLVLRVAEP